MLAASVVCTEQACCPFIVFLLLAPKRVSRCSQNTELTLFLCYCCFRLWQTTQETTAPYALPTGAAARKPIVAPGERIRVGVRKRPLSDREVCVGPFVHGLTCAFGRSAAWPTKSTRAVSDRSFRAFVILPQERSWAAWCCTQLIGSYGRSAEFLFVLAPPPAQLLNAYKHCAEAQRRGGRRSLRGRQHCADH